MKCMTCGQPFDPNQSDALEPCVYCGSKCEPRGTMRRQKPRRHPIQIEFPSVGATYTKREYGIYQYDRYPRHSVLAGQTRRTFLDSFKTLAEAKEKYPEAHVSVMSGYAPPDLSHLPDDTDY